MKAIQVMFDEPLLAMLDAEREVKREGRSAVLRRLVAEHLRRKRHDRIAEQYRRAYAGQKGLVDELDGWADQGDWPEP